jgi:nitrite reductase/ring-hydroxylating ferredoxin subunit
MQTPANLRWTPVGKVTDWPAEGGKPVQVGPRRIAVFHHGGQWFAVKDVCPHAGIALAKGPLKDGTVGCPGHGWKFDLVSGDLVSGPTGFSVPVYAARATAEGVVEVGL